MVKVISYRNTLKSGFRNMVENNLMLDMVSRAYNLGE